MIELFYWGGWALYLLCVTLAYWLMWSALSWSKNRWLGQLIRLWLAILLYTPAMLLQQSDDEVWLAPAAVVFLFDQLQGYHEHAFDTGLMLALILIGATLLYLIAKLILALKNNAKKEPAHTR